MQLVRYPAASLPAHAILARGPALKTLARDSVYGLRPACCRHEPHACLHVCPHYAYSVPLGSPKVKIEFIGPACPVDRFEVQIRDADSQIWIPCIARWQDKVSWCAWEVTRGWTSHHWTGARSRSEQNLNQSGVQGTYWAVGLRLRLAALPQALPHLSRATD